MNLERVHTSDVSGISSHLTGSRVIAAASASPPTEPVAIAATISTPLLRRCTALAAQARVELLTESRRSATEELEGVLTIIENWAPGEVVSPDPTMVTLAAAALQDLLERLSQVSRSTLEGRITRVLDVLHALMEASRVRAMA